MDADQENAKLLQKIIVSQELQNRKITMGREDSVLDIRFLRDQKTFRATYLCAKAGEDEADKHLWIDVNLVSKKISIRNGTHYCDKSILASKDKSEKTTQMKENLLVLINEEEHVGNKVQLPLDFDTNTVVVLNREDTKNFCFYVFDIRRNQFIRKIPKSTIEQQAFCLDHTGRVLGFVDGEQMFLKMCRLPNSKALN